VGVVVSRDRRLSPNSINDKIRAMHRSLLVVLLVVTAFGSSILPRPSGQANSQAPKPEVSPLESMQRDLAASKKALLSEATDLDEMGKSLRGVEGDTALSIDNKAGQGVMEIDATLWFADIYENMQCDADREVAKRTLSNRLAFYSHLLDLEADQTVGHLADTRLPAVAQSGQRVKENLRAAKATLDEMSASLK
jgi:hypothetical protein